MNRNTPVLKLFSLAVFFYCTESFCQPARILHYTETSVFDHQTRIASHAMFQQMGVQFGFTVDNDSTGQSFNSLSNLQQYDAVIFSNTTGNNILDTFQQQNFEQYINNNGVFIGIHSASDTYRHSTANGTNTGAWDWYAEMLGASVQENPNHVSGIPVYRIDAVTSHALLSAVPAPWHKAEEYYYWENGYFDSSNITLLKVEQTIGPNLQVNSYDSARAVTWYKILPGGGRSFYTALGHAASNYISDTSFYRLLSNAVLWADDSTSGIPAIDKGNSLIVYPNPVLAELKIYNENLKFEAVETIDMFGREIYSLQQTANTKEQVIDISSLDSGIYFLRVKTEKGIATVKFVKQ